MTALGAPVAPARVDVVRIRRTYTAVLGDPRIGGPLLGEEQRAHLAGLIRGQMWLMLPAVEETVPAIANAFNRSAAELVLGKVRAALARPVLGASSPDDVFDLAILSRVLLNLHEYPSQDGR
ncbi:hypothetical protein [Streptomyces sp. NPDC056683]|uniref:hypothetical protein n=1 Tax=Streptomyces sp. NPDC056683 TaxID=3345910 RepID=UPI00369D45CF